MVYIILAFLAGLAIGVLCVRHFAPNVITKYKIVEKVVTKPLEKTESQPVKDNTYVPKKFAKKE